MKQSSALKYRQAKALIANGSGIGAACRKVGISTPTFYSQKRKQETAPSVDYEVGATSHTSGELTLEEQVISSNLSPKAKVKVLTTLLNA